MYVKGQNPQYLGPFEEVQQWKKKVSKSLQWLLGSEGSNFSDF